MKGNRSQLFRNRVAQEAALLLYTSQEMEYKQAKQRAAKILGIRVLPSNLEVANKLDSIAEEREGAQRKARILRMRQEAKEIMVTLLDIKSRLVGSVWRGTANKNSDIDIYAFTQDHHMVVKKLQKQNYEIMDTKWRAVTKCGVKETSFHIKVVLMSGDNVEVVVRKPDSIRQKEKCETYGDIKTGVNIRQLSKILKENPFQKFVPN
ncbi:nucleotidyltransferase domain-containing protein [Candidatus Bathyarchaeota archaeon]|nr:nucleotidyltransferase domain-containing protein [Candidatus Bathyarchaeota archaeon]